eukprot:2923425-Prymnesium_polylepis.1
MPPPQRTCVVLDHAIADGLWKAELPHGQLHLVQLLAVGSLCAVDASEEDAKVAQRRWLSRADEAQTRAPWLMSEGAQPCGLPFPRA